MAAWTPSRHHQPPRRTAGRTELNGKLIWITGASSGIGEATARCLAAEGARVALSGRRRERLDAIAEAIAGEGGSAEVLPRTLPRSRGGRRRGLGKPWKSAAGGGA
ncbi:MAG: SDR family NAD(P)-dependent oxidoreductase [Arhodomonas sp.]|nr:SDR family NAD(P)-dependent oxidoreductase [Arhodomonas sp.]